MSIKFANNAFGTLNAGISSSDTSITLSSGQGARFPVLASGEYFYITLIDTSNNLEVVKCTARSTDVLTVTRAQDNTTARAFAIGDRVELRVTAAALEDSTNPYDKDTSSTGSFALPSGTTAQQLRTLKATYATILMIALYIIQMVQTG
jgi:ribosomal protein L18